MNDTVKRVLGVIAVVAVLAIVGVLWLRGAADERLDECEHALDEWVSGPEDAPQPSILTEDWCFDHLTSEGNAP